MPNNVLVIASAQWEVTGTIDNPGNVFIRGSGTGGINVPSTNASVSGSTVSISNVTSAQTFPNTTKYYNPFTITWEVSFDGGSTWQSAGTSANVIYVCLANPTPTLFRTVVHLACSNDGATDADTAMAKTWALYSPSTAANPGAGPNNVMAWDEPTQTWTRKLYYYEAGRKFGESANSTVAELLGPTYGGSGQCGVWAYFLQDALAVNGIASTVTSALITGASGYGLFWVKNWTINAMPGQFSFPGSPGQPRNDLLPTPAGGNYGAMTNAVGVPGPNSPTPSQKSWGDHAFVKYKTLFYDPSYGLIHTGPANFQTTAITCFGTYLGRGPTGQYIYNVNTDANTVIYFDP